MLVSKVPLRVFHDPHLEMNIWEGNVLDIKTILSNTVPEILF